MARHAKPNPENPEYVAAMRRANAVRAYWLSRGFAVNVWVERGEFSPIIRSVAYSVRTDLVNGMPKGVTQNFLSRVGPSGRMSAAS